SLTNSHFRRTRSRRIERRGFKLHATTHANDLRSTILDSRARLYYHAIVVHNLICSNIPPNLYLSKRRIFQSSMWLLLCLSSDNEVLEQMELLTTSAPDFYRVDHALTITEAAQWNSVRKHDVFVLDSDRPGMSSFGMCG